MITFNASSGQMVNSRAKRNGILSICNLFGYIFSYVHFSEISTRLGIKRLETTLKWSIMTLSASSDRKVNFRAKNHMSISIGNIFCYNFAYVSYSDISTRLEDISLVVVFPIESITLNASSGRTVNYSASGHGKFFT